MKLSARAFNNILIFSMLAMIMLFNMDSWLPKPDAPDRMALIAEQDLILRIDIEGEIGASWHSVALDR